MTRLAALQGGVLTLEQALGHGLTEKVVRRLVRDASWFRLAGGCYSTANAEPSWDTWAWAGVLLGGERARLGPLASGSVVGLLPTAPAVVDVLVPVASPIRVAGPWRFICERPGVRSPRSVGAPRRLNVEDTVLDLCDAGGESEVISLVTTAQQRRLTTAKQLRTALEARRRHRHRRLLHDVLGDVADGVHSTLEYHYLRDVERAHGLPRGTRQTSRAGLRYQTDVDYSLFMLLIELDGRTGHEGNERFRDMWRDNLHALAEWLTLRFGWWDVVHRPCAVAMLVAQALAARGWPGVPTRCPRCALVPDRDLFGVV